VRHEWAAAVPTTWDAVASPLLRVTGSWGRSSRPAPAANSASRAPPKLLVRLYPHGTGSKPGASGDLHVHALGVEREVARDAGRLGARELV
jgi:hypothetical protein